MYRHFLFYFFCGIFSTLLVASEGQNQSSQALVTILKIKSYVDLYVLSDKAQADCFYKIASYHPRYCNLNRCDIDNQMASFKLSSINQSQEKFIIQACYAGTKGFFAGTSASIEVYKEDIIQQLEDVIKQGNENNLPLGIAFKKREGKSDIPVFKMQLSQENINYIINHNDNSKTIEKKIPVIEDPIILTNISWFNAHIKEIMGISVVCLIVFLSLFSSKIKLLYA